MPELPEVETLVQQLKKILLRKKIISVEIYDHKMIDSKIKKIVPVKIVGVKRRAKSIIIELEKDFLLVHLRMTGHFHYVTKGKSLNPDYQKFIVAKFQLNDNSVLTHHSIRKFGSIKLMNKKQLDLEMNKLGPEPLDKKFTVNLFKEILSKRNKANVKTTLMDQKILAGIGNIYAQEALYWTGIDPQRKIETLSEKEIEKLYHKLGEILKLAVKHHGTTVENYVHIEGTGGFQKLLTV